MTSPELDLAQYSPILNMYSVYEYKYVHKSFLISLKNGSFSKYNVFFIVFVIIIQQEISEREGRNIKIGYRHHHSLSAKIIHYKLIIRVSEISIFIMFCLRHFLLFFPGYLISLILLKLAIPTKDQCLTLEVRLGQVPITAQSIFTSLKRASLRIFIKYFLDTN